MATIPAPARRGFEIKPLHIAGVGIILLAIIYGLFGFKDAFRAYTTSVDEAISSSRSIQLAGFLGSKGEMDDTGRFTFMLQDSDKKMVKVISDDPRPANFEQAISIVAIGHYDSAQQAFMADDLLVKCPSKYQELQASASK
ncbi:cytochrome c maturation protein CcmE [Oscillochloris sp. ZM17-4]|uniref:cytochrome c maturation protein CcmE domain-containing protein n=1 Tax=Oscillochloris sp. ZM17-4 TaxID=2866714 RepID=UPI001C72BE31|nr:cytochrome c maturation protein CcmE [Oscillochloris sp. ZM17-4]MBX0327075.1 cytochrome c maturation protein CcmE [Oscillochloris sp. ZM17-4]